MNNDLLIANSLTCNARYTSNIYFECNNSRGQYVTICMHSALVEHVEV